MSSQMTRRLRPEDEELFRKREEFAAIRAALAEREVELADLRNQLAAFEGRYLRQVGVLYAELDDWRARISELQAQLHPSDAATEHAREAREQARETYEDTHGKASEREEFTSSAELRSLFREVAKKIHPDFCRDAADLERRTRLMAEANRSYQTGDAEALQRILDDYKAEAVDGEGVGAELIRIIRQISVAKDRVSAIEQELSSLRQSEIALLKKQAEEAERAGRDLLAELAASVHAKILTSEKEYKILAHELGSSR